MFKVNNKETRTTSLTWTYFAPCSSVSIVNFAQVNADCDRVDEKQRHLSKVAVSKVVVRRCSVKKVFLVISKTSQESNCARASFLIKLQA